MRYGGSGGKLNAGQRVAQYGGIPISRRDISLLKPGRWLNDEVCLTCTTVVSETVIYVICG